MKLCLAIRISKVSFVWGYRVGDAFFFLLQFARFLQLDKSFK